MKLTARSIGVFLLTTSFVLVIMIPHSGAAPMLQIGDIALKLDWQGVFDPPDQNGDGKSDLPGIDGSPNTVDLPSASGSQFDWSTGSGRTWGIAQITGIYKITAGDIENPTTLSSLPLWTPSSGDFLFARFGGLKLDTAHAGYPPAAFPYDLYFDKDADNDYTKSGVAYLEVFNVNFDAYALDATAGPGDGKYGSFGTNMDDGTLWLDVALTPGILENYDSLAEGPNGGFAASDWDIEKSTVTSLTTGGFIFYGDIVGGAALSSYIFQDGAFPLNPVNAVKADLQFQGTLNPIFNPATGKYTDPNGWVSEGQDPSTLQVVPEPASLLLFGSGLAGLGGFIRRRRNK
ncbi:VPLPA-CTERM protein sorting domain-containing protein [Desulfacinum infernum DSM 9756]|uniref:VPLPA-CTERM protein sorting domain-containing protein n=1 Tax=Desulfacinum infernum DSM 9756 TaxID=1121391 RepID=A0A1M5JFX7_9BACT|nr:PEP-CTERM sorting domain-containing protein [Desulfacinum infernum]SHG38943.1 VPLPA-CTERM protein sorting domain-containing protein [Desulfacinum infernum DSM 9756]